MADIILRRLGYDAKGFEMGMHSSDSAGAMDRMWDLLGGFRENTRGVPLVIFNNVSYVGGGETRDSWGRFKGAAA